MRINVLMVVALLAAAAPVCAQGRFGVEGGVNIATQQSDGPSLDSRTGLVAGAFYELPLAAGPLRVQVEALYAQRGARLTVRGIESTLALDYIDVPVLARIRFGSGHTRYFAAGGPSTAFRVRAKARTSFSSSVEEIDMADEVEAIDLGIAAGGGVEIGRLVVEARYTFGLTDVDKDPASRSKNRGIAATAGFRF